MRGNEAKVEGPKPLMVLNLFFNAYADLGVFYALMANIFKVRAGLEPYAILAFKNSELNP